jgi:hypothetical protein
LSFVSRPLDGDIVNNPGVGGAFVIIVIDAVLANDEDDKGLHFSVNDNVNPSGNAFGDSTKLDTIDWVAFGDSTKLDTIDWVASTVVISGLNA